MRGTTTAVFPSGRNARTHGSSNALAVAPGRERKAKGIRRVDGHFQVSVQQRNKKGELADAWLSEPQANGIASVRWMSYLPAMPGKRMAEVGPRSAWLKVWRAGVPLALDSDEAPKTRRLTDDDFSENAALANPEGWEQPLDVDAWTDDVVVGRVEYRDAGIERVIGSAQENEEELLSANPDIAFGERAFEKRRDVRERREAEGRSGLETCL